MKKFDEFQKLGPPNMDFALKSINDWNKGWQSIAAEMTDYTKRTFEEGTATFERLLSAKSLEQAFEIQSNYARRAYDEYMSQLTRLGSMYAAIAKDAYRPFESALAR